MKKISKESRTFFIPEENYIIQTDKATLLRFKPFSVWLNNKHVSYQKKAKNGKVYNSIWIKKDFKYTIFKEVFDITEDKMIKVENSDKEITGQQLIDLLFKEFKK